MKDLGDFLFETAKAVTLAQAEIYRRQDAENRSKVQTVEVRKEVPDVREGLAMEARRLQAEGGR